MGKMNEYSSFCFQFSLLLIGDPEDYYRSAGAGLQPTCEVCLKGCCHNLAIEYYTETIDNKERYIQK